MDSKILALKEHVKELSSNPKFIHHPWFIEWHLNIVERIALELLDYYPQADREIVMLMVWMHDYGKPIDFKNDYQVTQTAGREKLLELGFEPALVEKTMSYVDTMNRKLELDLREAPTEVQIVSSADGCSHLVGPFMYLWWYENPGKTFQELMAGNQRKAQKDWERKIVLPEARKAFQRHFEIVMEQSGTLGEKLVRA